MTLMSNRNRKLGVAESLLHPRLRGSRGPLLETTDAVVVFAHSVDLPLTHREAEQVRTACMSWLSRVALGDTPGPLAYEHHIVDALS